MRTIIIDLTSTPDFLTFADVKDDEFFINNYGQVCQKYDAASYHSLTNETGKNHCDRYENVKPSTMIKEILNIQFKR